MRLSLDWLKEFVVVKESPEKVAEILTLLGFEVEAIEQLGKNLSSIIVAQILEIRKHPNADKLQLVKVTDGNRKLNIVCGAWNIKAGQRVPLARVGTRLPNGKKISRVKIRGVESEGMLCSEKELNLGTDHAGIYILGNECKIGLGLDKALKLSDYVFEIAISPNRPDCLSVIGLAREYAAKTSRPLKNIKYTFVKKSAKKGARKLSVLNKNINLCPKYSARLVNNVKVSDSPDWLKARLIAVGIRPKNNIVDCTNYLMIENGQPLHAFDADKLHKNGNTMQIIIRNAESKEKVKTLDGHIRQLDRSILVIADSEKPVALAGIMGGEESQVTKETRNIILESARFNPLSIRRSSRQLGLRTDSSSRFEKGIDQAYTDIALDLAAGLISKLAGGEVSRDKVVKTAKKLQSVKKITVAADYINNLIGSAISAQKMKVFLKKLGCQVSGSAKELGVVPPSWRSDLNIGADIAEEVGRLDGYNNLKPTLLTGLLKPAVNDMILTGSEKMADLMVRLGYSEVRNYSFYGLSDARTTEVEPERHYKISNPLSPEQEYLRVSLMPRLKENLRKNSGLGSDLRLFEIGKTYQPGAELPDENTVLGLALNIQREDNQSVFSEFKGVINNICDVLGVNELVELQLAGNAKYLIKLSSGDEIGLIYIMSSSELSSLKLKGAAGLCGIRLNNLFVKMTDQKKYRSFSSYPSIERDLSVIVNEKIKFAQLVNVICRINRETVSQNEPDGLISNFYLFGKIFRNQKLGLSKKSVPLRIIYQSPIRTLTNSEIDKLQNNIISKLQREVGAEIKNN